MLHLYQNKPKQRLVKIKYKSLPAHPAKEPVAATAKNAAHQWNKSRPLAN